MIPEARRATEADLPVVLAAQHAVAQALPGVEPWTPEQARGLFENMQHPRGQWLFLVAPTGPAGEVEGFMLVSRHRNPPPAPDPRELQVKLVASLVLGDGDDRARLRRVAISTFRALTRLCHTEGLVWEARAKAGERFAVQGLIAEMAPRTRVTVATVTEADGTQWTVVRSADQVMHPDAVPWPDR